MDLGSAFSNLTGGGSVDPAQLTTAVGDLFASKGGVDGLIATLRSASPKSWNGFPRILMC